MRPVVCGRTHPVIGKVLLLSAAAFALGALSVGGQARTTPEATRALLTALAHDSLQGRETGEVGSIRAAGVIARAMQRIGLEPAGDDGYYQRVPAAMMPVTGRNGQTTLRLARLPSFAALDSIPRERHRTVMNVVGILRGTDGATGQHVLVDAHYDHVGMRARLDASGNRIPGADSIWNGADDDASGVVAVLEIARQLAAGPRPPRTVVFAAMTGEEINLVGTRWYIEHPVLPLDRMAANFEIEMIGRPDSLAGGAGKGWLTGYERSTMGESLAARGIPLVADPRPRQNFFSRSDNIAFARAGIPAHTLSSFNLHTDYHQPSDEVDKVDFSHMAAVINAATDAVRLLVEGPAPTWKPGLRPCAQGEAPRAGVCTP
jgi:hypothetical protein